MRFIEITFSKLFKLVKLVKLVELVKLVRWLYKLFIANANLLISLRLESAI